MASYAMDDDSVVVVVGSGAGGGTLANELCQKGVPVVLLEAGKRESPATFVNDERGAVRQLAWLDKRVTSGSPGSPTWTCKTVGGTTTQWAGASLRFQKHEFKALTTYGRVAGANLLDWPLGYEELAPWYDKAEDRMGVTRTHGIPGLPGNNNFKVFYAGARKLGYENVHTGRMAINSRPRAGRAACLQIGFCFQGCKIGSKWSTLYAEIPQAEATGKLDLRPECFATRVEHDPAGKASGVIYFDRDGKEQRQRARAVCLACNSIETARLLLNSASFQHPDGLANSSGQVGRNYQRHVAGSVFAIFDRPVRMWRGATQAGIVTDESRHDPGRGFAGGYEMETLSLGLPFTAAVLAGSLSPGAWGREFTSLMDGYANMSGMWLVGEDMPQGTNRITLHPTEKDRFRMPIPALHYDDHPNDVAMRAHARRQGKAVYEAVGAKRVILTPPGAATHNMGVARMAATARDGVCDKWGQTFDVPNLFVSDGSLFTTSGAENPTLTIVALALRQADYLAGQMSRRAL